MKQYLDLIKKILDSGNDKEDRTGTGTVSIFGEMIKFDLRDGFPLQTTKQMFTKGIIGELLWFIEGSTNVERLREITFGPNCEGKKTIWDDNYNKQAVDLGYDNGELGPVYGRQWRRWSYITQPYGEFNLSVRKSVDQLQNAIDLINNNPESRRIIVNSWNAPLIPEMALPPCHYCYQFNVEGDYLDIMWNQRSVDTVLGLPFNIASYSLLLMIIAKITNKIPRFVVGSLADVHIYHNHHTLDLYEMIDREPYKLPTMIIPEINSLHEIKNISVNDFKLVNYIHHPAIKTFKMAV